MKNIFTNPFWKFFLVIILLTGTFLLFRVIKNKDVKIFIGIGGLLLMSYSVIKKKKE